MSTRSRIGYVSAAGAVRSVYCHSDGYLEGVGATLDEDYRDMVKVVQLIDLGDLSMLDGDLDNIAAYIRDRGEKGCEATTSADLDAFLKIDSGQEYSYIWRDNDWYVWCHHTNSPVRGLKLTPALIAEALDA